jgi:hypothetical protein
VGGDQSEQDHEGFLVGEHQRRHPVPGPQPDAAVRAAHRLHRDVEVDEVGDVAAHRPLVDLQARGQIGDGPGGRAGLQQLEQLQHAGRRTGHPHIVPENRADPVRYRP